MSFYKWQTHRFDWRESATDFYGDAGRHKLQIDRQVPVGDSQLTLNMWSTGNDWTRPLEVDGVAEFQILWIEWAFNTSDTADATCSNACDLDGAQVGYLSPSKFAEEQFAMNNGTDAPVALPATEEEADPTANSTSGEESNPTSAASTKVWVSMFLLAAGLCFATLM